MPFAPWFDLRVVRSHLSAWIRAPPTISEATASRLHLVEPGKKNVRVSRSSCVEWSDAMESVFMVCGRRPRRPEAKITQDRCREKTRHSSLASAVYFSNACLLGYGRRPRSAQTHPRVFRRDLREHPGAHHEICFSNSRAATSAVGGGRAGLIILASFNVLPFLDLG